MGDKFCGPFSHRALCIATAYITSIAADGVLNLTESSEYSFSIFFKTLLLDSDAGDPVGDELRDRMDPIWLKLSEEDRAALDHRIGDPSLFAGRLVGPPDRRDMSVRSEVRAQFRRAA